MKGEKVLYIDRTLMKKKIMTMALAVLMTMALAVPAYAATGIGIADSVEDVVTDTLDKTNGTDYFVDEDTNNWNNGQITEEVRVNVDRASFFDITIPKEIVLNGNNGSASYEVSITGELAGDQALVVKPDATFTLTEDGGKTTPVTVEQDKDTFNYQDINNSKKGNGALLASGISAGNWSGKFNFNIEFKNIHDTSKHILMDLEPVSSGNFRIRLSKEAGAIYSPDIIYTDNQHNIVSDVTTENFDEKLENGLYFESEGGFEPSKENEFSKLAKIYPNVSICVYSYWYFEEGKEEEFIGQFDGFDTSLRNYLFQASMSHQQTAYYHLK